VDGLLWDRIEEIRTGFPATPTIPLPHPRLRMFVKMESANPSGSAKDRAALWILRGAVLRGEITRNTTVVESSSGNFALALARFCGRLGLRFVPVLDPNVNAATERALRRTCARVEKVHAADHTGGYLLSRLARVAELRSEIDNAYWSDQYANVDGALGHYHLTGAELVDSVGHIDHLFVGVGTGATIAGLSRRVTESSPEALVVAVDVEGSAIFDGAPARRRIPGIGSSIRPPLVNRARIGTVLTVSEQDEVAGAHAMLRDHGMLVGGSTGCVYAAINRYFADYEGPPPVVAFLCADGGEPYLDTIYDRGWVAANLGAVPELSDERRGERI
jgi:2,3-diaminopropionate biosynthesis protein SbnA